MFGVFSGLTFFGKLTFWSVDLLEVDHFSQYRVNKKAACGKHSIRRARDEETKSYARFDHEEDADDEEEVKNLVLQ